MSNKESEPEPTGIAETLRDISHESMLNVSEKHSLLAIAREIDRLTAEREIAFIALNKHQPPTIGGNDLGEQVKELLKHIDHLTAELASANDGVEHGNEVIEDLVKKFEGYEAELKAKDTAITYLLEASAPMTPQQEECWPVLRQALKEKP